MRIIFFLISCLISETLFAANYKELTIKEPISETKFHFTEAIILDSSATNYLKYRLELPASYVSIYSMKNAENSTVSWAKINEFDANNKYGTFITKERLDDRRDGWIRYYKKQNNKGKFYINCVSLIRGKNYVVYVLESANTIEQLSTPEVVKNADFRKICKQKKYISPVYIWSFWSVLVLSLVIFILIRLFFKASSKSIYLLGSIILVASGIFQFFVLEFSITEIICISFFYAIVYLNIGLLNNWTELFQAIKRIVEN